MMPNPVQTQMNYANVNDLMKLQQQYNMMFNKNNVLAFNDMLSSMNLNYASLKEMIRKDVSILFNCIIHIIIVLNR